MLQVRAEAAPMVVEGAEAGGGALIEKRGDPGGDIRHAILGPRWNLDVATFQFRHPEQD